MRIFFTLLLFYLCIFPVNSSEQRPFKKKLEKICLELYSAGKQKNEDLYTAKYAELEALCKEFIENNPEISLHDKVDIYTKLADYSIPGFKSPEDEKEKFLQYIKKIIDISKDKLSPDIILAHVNYAFAVESNPREDEYIKLYKYLYQINNMTDKEIISRLVVKNNPAEQVKRIRQTTGSQITPMVKYKFPSLLKSSKDDELKQKISMMFEKFPPKIRRPVKKNRVLQIPPPKETMQELARKLASARVTKISPMGWRQMLDDKKKLFEGIRTCDLAVANLVRKMRLYSYTVEKEWGGINTNTVMRYPENVRDKITAEFKERLFPPDVKNWNDAYRNVTEEIIKRLSVRVPFDENNSNWDYITLMFGTDFAKDADMYSAINALRKHWEKVKTLPYLKWKVPVVHIAEYQKKTNEYYNKFELNINKLAIRREEFLKRIPEVKVLLKKLRDKMKTAADTKEQKKLRKECIENLEKLKRKHMNDPDICFIDEIIKELSR
jgi:hypothetical protein